MQELAKINFFNITKAGFYDGAEYAAGSVVGSADIEMTETSDGRIPGYATYFWIIPSKNVLATSRIRKR